MESGSKTSGARFVKPFILELVFSSSKIFSLVDIVNVTEYFTCTAKPSKNTIIAAKAADQSVTTLLRWTMALLTAHPE